MPDRKYVYIVTARSELTGELVLLDAYDTEVSAEDFVKFAHREELTDDGHTTLVSHADALGLRLRVVPVRVKGNGR